MKTHAGILDMYRAMRDITLDFAGAASGAFQNMLSCMQEELCKVGFGPLLGSAGMPQSGSAYSGSSGFNLGSIVPQAVIDFVVCVGCGIRDCGSVSRCLWDGAFRLLPSGPTGCNQQLRSGPCSPLICSRVHTLTHLAQRA